MKKNSIIFILIFILSIIQTFAFKDTIDSTAKIEYVRSDINYYFGLSFTNCVPQKDFQDNIKSSGQGFSFYGGGFIKPLPISIGLSFDVIYFSYDPSLNFSDGFDVISTKTTAIPIDLVLRFQPLSGLIMPFFESFGGYTILSASSEYSPAGSTVEPFNESRISGAFHYGFGGGVLLKLTKSSSEKVPNVSIYSELKVRYIYGDFTDYHTVFIDSHEYPVFVNHASKTNMINVQIGFTFIF
jgi:hypothetical protein